MVCDLFDTDGTIIPYDILVGRGLPRNLFLKWRGILSAIPSSWKHVFKQGYDRHDCNLNKFVINDNEIDVNSIKNMNSRCIYRILVKRIFIQPTSQIKYKNEFDIDDDEWNNIYLRPFNSCLEVKLRMFQYKINVNCLMTNKRLCKMNITDSDRCSFCNNHSEDMKHLFWDCNCVKSIWNDFDDWYHRYFNIDIDLNYKLILFGIGSDPLLNLCLILMKRVIYNSKFKKQTPSFISFKCMVNFHYNLEKQIAMKCGTMYKFFKKWKALETFCS